MTFSDLDNVVYNSSTTREPGILGLLGSGMLAGIARYVARSCSNRSLQSSSRQAGAEQLGLLFAVSSRFAPFLLPMFHALPECS